jgi:ParB family chromosome partitioning protein
MLLHIEVDKVIATSNRKYGGEGNISILAESIKQVGLINPIVVIPAEDETYQLVAGRRRLAAVKLLGWREIPSIFPEGIELNPRLHGEAERKRLEEITLTENVNREDMHPLDEGEIFSSMLKAGAKLKELAHTYNRSISGIYQRSQLAKLIEPFKSMFREGNMDLSSAAMIGTFKKRLQEQFYEEAKEIRKVDRYRVHDFILRAQNRPIRFFNTCGRCKKRTYCTDPDLFPEYNNLEDVCFDDACYRKTWIELLGREIQKAEEAAGTGLRHIYWAIESYSPFQDEKIMVNGKEFFVIIMDNNPLLYISTEADEGDRGKPEFTAWVVQANENDDELEIQAGNCYKIAKNEDGPPPKLFHIEQYVDEKELEKAESALARKYQYQFSFQREVSKRVAYKAVIKSAYSDYNFSPTFLKQRIAIQSKEAKKLYVLYTGEHFSRDKDNDFAAFCRMPISKQHSFLFSLDFLRNFGFYVPGYLQFDPAKAEVLREFSGCTEDELTAVYRESITEVINESIEEVEAEAGHDVSADNPE